MRRHGRVLVRLVLVRRWARLLRHAENLHYGGELHVSSPIVIFQGGAKAKTEGAVEEVASRVETRGVRLNIPDGPAITVSATRKDEGSWEDPAAEVPQGKLDYAMWQDLVKTVEKGFAEYSARFEDQKPGVDGSKKSRKKKEVVVAVPQPECLCFVYGMGMCPVHGVRR